MKTFRVNAGESKRLVQGTYEVYICAVDEIKKSKSGNEFFTVNYKIREGEYKDMEIRFDNFYLSEKSLWRLSVLAKALGYTEGTDLDIEEFRKSLLGKSLMIETTEDEKGYQKPNKYYESELPDVEMNLESTVSDEDLEGLF